MKAVVYEKYGPPEVLQLKEVEKPSPKENEVLVKVYATTVTTGDINARSFLFVPRGLGILPRLMFGLRRPRKTILGMEFAGEIEALGGEVKSFRVGDPVFGTTGAAYGAHAEYVCVPEGGSLALKPANMSIEEAAALPFGGSTALYFLRDKVKVHSGQKALVYGASGNVGVYALQIANHYGAEVDAVCSTANLELVKSLGAARVFDYTRQDFTLGGEVYDIIHDTVGRTNFSTCKDSLKDDGLYIASAGGLAEFWQMFRTSISGGKRVIAGVAPDRKEYLLTLKELVEAGEIKAVIDRRYPLEKTAEASRYVEEGHKKGSVVITVSH